MAASKNRRLAAIFFADIVDYSAMMQRNEAEGIIIVSHYRAILRKKVSEHQGEILQHYGDGSLIIFSSGIAALQCAKELQEIFRTSPKVPLRIGIHIGDIVINGSDVFGDGVNIAARIESLSIAGGVLFSSRLLPDIKSHPEFTKIGLGAFQLKNIEEPVSIFALSNEGFPVPDRKDILAKLNSRKKPNNNLLLYSIAASVLLVIGFCFAYLFSDFSTFHSPLSKEIREKKVAVMEFENQTNSKKLENFGLMASDWLTQGLMELPGVDVANMPSVFDNLSLSGANIVASKYADILIRGRYYERGDTLMIYCNITDANTGKVYFALDPIQKPKVEAMQSLEELTQRILGYWALAENKKYSKQVPKYEAYKASIEANHYFYIDTKKVEERLLYAYQADTNFIEPLIKLAKYYSIRGRVGMCDSLLMVIKEKNAPLTGFEKLRLEAIEARVSGHFEKAAVANLEIAERYDPAYYNNVVGRFLDANLVTKALKVVPYVLNLKEISTSSIKQEGRLSRPLSTHYRLGNFERIRSMMDTVLQQEDNSIMINKIPDLHLRALLNLNQLSEADRYLDFYLDPANPKLNYANRHSARVILRWFCYEWYRLNKALPAKYKQLLLDNELLYEWYTVSENYPKILSIAKEELKIHPTSKYWMAVAGRACAHQGLTYQAEDWIQELNAQPDTYKRGDSAYSEAVVRAALGQKDQAVALLRKAHKEGFGFSARTYQYHPILKPLHDYPAFVEFVQAK